MEQLEKRINQIMSQLTLKEKVGLCHANSKFTAGGVPRLGIEDITTSDGPHGVREEMSRDNWDVLNRDDDYCTYLPTATALAATWNPVLAEKFGDVLGAEARFRGKDFILGPGINIIRNPLGGRNFEYMSEDPCLISKLVAPLTRGIQSHDTAACVKHYALNNQELDRKNVNVEVSRRALHEIYLKGFRAAVREGGAYSVMGAYNRYENQFCCHHKYLVCDLLKGQWGFDGVYISDWAGTHDTEEAVNCGLDLEMGTEKPYNEFYLADPFEKLIQDRPELEKKLDEKVRRILRVLLRIRKTDPARDPGSFNTPEHQQVAYDVAKEAIVLLKNQNVLPLAESIISILVVGDNATRKHAHGGNSCGVKAYYERTQLEGIQSRFPHCSIEYVKTSRPHYDYIPVETLKISDMGSGSRAFRCQYYENDQFGGEPVIRYQGAVEEDRTFGSAVYEATVCIPEDGVYHFRVRGGKQICFRVNGETVNGDELGQYKHSANYRKGEEVHLYLTCAGYAEQPLELLWSDMDENMTLATLVEKAQKADCVIYCGGLNHNYDVEEFDRKDMKLPDVQNEEIKALLQVNRNTVIVMTSGSPVEMPWIEDAPAVIWSWYAGMEGGNALADILKGTVCPSGKLPYTMPKKLEDSPAFRYGEYRAENCRYNEGIYVGYRGFDKDDVDPLYCFGHGLSYVNFTYSDLEVTSAENGILVSFTVCNEGKQKAAETAQVYVGLDNSRMECPIRELKAFTKVYLDGGEAQRVSVPLAKEDFAVFDENADDWAILSDHCKIEVGSSSRDIRLQKDKVAIPFRRL